MGLIQYVVYLGEIYLLVIYSLKAVQIPVTILSSFIGVSKKATFWVNCPLLAFGTYLLVSLTARATLIGISGQSGSLSTVLYIAIGGIIIYMSEANTTQGRHERIQKENIASIDCKVVKYSDYADRITVCGGLILYGLSISSPTLVPDKLTDPILAVIGIASKTLIFGLIIKGLGIVNPVGIMMGGCLLSGRMLQQIYRRRAGGLVGASKLSR